MNWETVKEFENKVAEFFGAPYGIAVDSATHGMELSLRWTHADMIYCPKRTYLSVPMLADKLNIKRQWMDWKWSEYYWLTPRVIDAAVFWKRNGYIRTTFMCLSFQFQKHLSLGRGGMILCDNDAAATILRRMVYDGRVPGIPWREQDVDMIGYHYYMTPETAQLGLDRLQTAVDTEPKKWKIEDWPDLTTMKVFNI